MTATHLAERPVAADEGEASGSADRNEAGLGLDALATLGLLAFSVTVAIGFSRVFFGSDFLRDLITIAVVGHVGSFVVRRLRTPAFVAIPLMLVVLVWLTVRIYYPDTFSGVLPLSRTWNAVRSDFQIVQGDFQTSTAPVRYDTGWAFLAGATTAATVWLSDTFAFRAQARGEALVPGIVLFVFIAALGIDENRTACSLAVIGAGFVALALLRVRLERRPRTVLGQGHGHGHGHGPDSGSGAGRVRHQLWTVGPAALVSATLVVVGAWLVAPRLPGANEEPLFDTTSSRDGATEIVSPLVDIRQRLVNQADTELFRVRADLPSYWRASALPEFDGDQWGLPGGDLSTADPLGQPRAGAVLNNEVITILGLRGVLIPVAPDPVSARGPFPGFNARTATLARTDAGLDDGDSYEVVSAMPRFAPDVLRAASSVSPPGDGLTDVPDDLPAMVADTARAVTAGAPTGFDQMLMLQDWFRSEFTYSTDIPPGSDPAAISNFLTNRVGYCEQFAGSFAAMARTLGLPARVAVGFTQGELGEDGTYLVRGRNAHAWPEVWFDGLGWVAFEPTPGRGMPGAESYTGLAPEQDEPTDSTVPPPTTTTTTTTTLPGADQQQTPPPPTTVPDVPAPPPDSSTTFPWLVVLAVVALIAGAVGLPEGVRRWRRRRHRTSSDPRHALLELWDRALTSMSAIGFRTDPAFTPREVSRQAAMAFPAVADPMADLAEMATAASYASVDEVEHLWYEDDPHDWCELVEDTVESSLRLPERVRRYFTVWR